MFIRVEGHQGDTLDASVTEFVPLSYNDLAETQKKKNSDNKLRIVANSNEHTFNDHQITEQSELSFNVTFPHQVSIFALVEGGWLPPPFVMSKLFMMDHNVVTVLKKINNGSQRLDHVASMQVREILSEIRNKEAIARGSSVKIRKRLEKLGSVPDLLFLIF